jgi:hypothetical protein
MSQPGSRTCLPPMMGLTLPPSGALVVLLADLALYRCTQALVSARGGTSTTPLLPACGGVGQQSV